MLELGFLCRGVVWGGDSWRQELRKQILGQHWNQDWTETSESLPMAHQSCVYRIRPRVSPRLAKAAQNGQA